MVLVFAESHEGIFKKGAFEAMTYGAAVAKTLGTDAAALTIGAVQAADELGVYGAKKVYNVPYNGGFDSQVYTSIIVDAAKKFGATVVILSHSTVGKSLVGRVSTRLEAGSVTGVNMLPTFNNGVFAVKRNVFSGKAIAEYSVATPIRVLTLMGNSIPLAAIGSQVAVETLAVQAPEARIKVLSTDTVKGTVPLPEAELVVSAGRGMKGPENWGMIEEMADILGATTACSRPVADIHWRPHHEHVGQTGIAIRPNLYIAIGISGAIQHLAGVNSSKCIVVINKDPEAPFFKAADYGICGDLFEIVPQLNAELRKFKAAN